LASLSETFDKKLEVLKFSEDLNNLSLDGEIEKKDSEEKEKRQKEDEEKDKDSLEERDVERLMINVEEDRRSVLAPRPFIDNPKVKRSESLNKADKPDMGLKVRRSESLGKADIRRSDTLTKTEKTETNMKVININNSTGMSYVQNQIQLKN